MLLETRTTKKGCFIEHTRNAYKSMRRVKDSDEETGDKTGIKKNCWSWEPNGTYITMHLNTTTRTVGLDTIPNLCTPSLATPPLRASDLNPPPPLSLLDPPKLSAAPPTPNQSGSLRAPEGRCMGPTERRRGWADEGCHGGCPGPRAMEARRLTITSQKAVWTLIPAAREGGGLVQDPTSPPPWLRGDGNFMGREGPSFPEWTQGYH